MLPPLAFCVMAPLERMPALLPPAVSLAVMVMLPLVLVSAPEPNERIFAAVVPVAVIDMPVPAEILPV